MVSSKEILLCKKMFGTAWVCQIERCRLIQTDFRGLLYIYSILLAFINDGLTQLRSQSSSPHRANRPVDKCRTNAINVLFCFFIGRLGLGNEDDCAAPQKVT